MLIRQAALAGLGLLAAVSLMMIVRILASTIRTKRMNDELSRRRL